MTSKLIADDGSPSPWWMRTATDGSRCGRVIDVLMRRPTSLASHARLGERTTPGVDGGRVECHALFPIATLANSGDPLEQPGRQLQTLEHGQKPALDLSGRGDAICHGGRN